MPDFYAIGSFASNVGAVIAGSIIAKQGILFSHPNSPGADFVDLTASGSIFAAQYGVAMGEGTRFGLENAGSISSQQDGVI